MIPNLESLILLQKIDLKITELVQSQSTFPKELADLEAIIEQHQWQNYGN